MTITLQDLQVLNEKATQGECEVCATPYNDTWYPGYTLHARLSDNTPVRIGDTSMLSSRGRENAAFIAALVNYYRSGALQRLAELSEWALKEQRPAKALQRRPRPVRQGGEIVNDEQFLKAVSAEVKRARRKFPGENATNAALVEEVGEVSTALMFEPWSNVIAEAVQVAAMACRLATEGDSTFKDWRWKTIHEEGERYMGKKHLMPNGLK